MKIFIPLLLCTVMIIVDIRGSHAKSNSSQLESKICNGHVAKPGERKYMASLQLDGRHICSAGVFKKHFLLTTADCVWYIEHSTKETKQKATAVLGDINLKNGQRVDIVRMAYHPRFKSDAQFCSNNFCDFGIVMLADTVDYTRVDILQLYKKRTDIRQHGREATVCGWTKKDYNEECSISEKENSDDLHCIETSLLSRTICTPSIPHGDYYINLICGIANLSNVTLTLGDVGSPLIKTIIENNDYNTYIVGVTLHTYSTKQDTFMRFIRSCIIHKNIDIVMNKFPTQEEAHDVPVRSSQESSPDRSSKRQKI